MATRKKANGSRKNNGKLSRRALLAGLGAGLTLTAASKGSALDVPDPTPTSPPKCELSMDPQKPTTCPLSNFGRVEIKKIDGKWQLVLYDNSQPPTALLLPAAKSISVNLNNNTLKASC